MINVAKISRWICVSFIFLNPKCAATRTALLVVDVQNCFLPGGSLAVPNGEAVVPVINSIRADYGHNFDLTVFTQDWHCPDHVSFAIEHEGRNVGDIITLQYDEAGNLCQTESTCNLAYNVSQMLWPVHCVINTTSAEFSTSLTHHSADIVVRKGYNCQVDSYSGFYDNGGFKHTELDKVLKSHKIQRVVVTGLAFDYCVFYTSKDASALGYETFVVEDACRAIADSTAHQAKSDMESQGIRVILSNDLKTLFQTSSAGRCISETLIGFVMILICVWASHCCH